MWLVDIVVCRSSTLSISVARELARFSSWRSVISSVRLWGIVLVEEYVGLIGKLNQKDCGECKLSSKIDCIGLPSLYLLLHMRTYFSSERKSTPSVSVSSFDVPKIKRFAFLVGHENTSPFGGNWCTLYLVSSWYIRVKSEATCPLPLGRRLLTNRVCRYRSAHHNASQGVILVYPGRGFCVREGIRARAGARHIGISHPQIKQQTLEPACEKCSRGVQSL